MTRYEPTPFPFKEGDEVVLLSNKDDSPLDTGTVTGVSDELLYITWDSCKEETDYPRSDLPRLKQI